MQQSSVALAGMLLAACLCVASQQCVHVAGSSVEDARSLNDEALELAYAGNLREALPLFQQAMQADPRSGEYINNVGVTFMRLGDMKEAKAMFEKALALDKRNNEARMNLEEVKGYLGEEDDFVFDGIFRHHLSDIPRIHINDLFKPENIHYARGETPFMVLGAMDTPAWRKARRTWDLELFAGRYGDANADFYPHNMDEENVRPYLTSLEEAAREFRAPSGAYPSSKKHPGTYIQWNLPLSIWNDLLDEVGRDSFPPLFLEDDAWLEGCMSSDKLRSEYLLETHWRMMLIGTKGAGMFNHQDTLRTASWQAQIKGSKSWHLCGPSENPHMYSAGDVDTFAPNYDKFPKFRKARCYKYTVREGEMMYYPRDWWHQTLIEDEGVSISITGTIVNAGNYDSVIEELSTDIARAKPIIIQPSPELAQEMPRCYQWLRDAYGGSLSQEPSTAACSLQS